MKNLKIVTTTKFPFEWVSLESYPDSKGVKVEIYLKNNDFEATALKEMFRILFSQIDAEILIYQEHWGKFCLDTWNIKNDTYDYLGDDLSLLTKNYISMLLESNIPLEYNGVCKCNDWSKFLSIILPCIDSGLAPYSPIIFSTIHDLFFYFHYTGSIGLYYRKESNFIRDLIKKAELNFEVHLIHD